MHKRAQYVFLIAKVQIIILSFNPWSKSTGQKKSHVAGPGRADLKLNGPGRADSRISCGPGRAVSKLNGPGRAGPTVLNVGPRARSGAHLDVPAPMLETYVNSVPVIFS